MNSPQTHSNLRLGICTLPLSLPSIRAFDTVIDVRSPAEYLEDHLPGAISCPVLSNEERIAIGTLYKQTSAFEAKRRGAAMVARNISRHLDESFSQFEKSWKPLIYCWRGGTRSGAMCHVLRSIGWQALQLDGGYKAWRGQVIRDLNDMPANLSFVVICGRTGSGKSRLLEALDQSGRQVLDLEKLAAHRGSVLGDIPDERQPSQKMFETRIWHQLSGFEPGRPVYVEAESKRVGALRVPDALMEQMRTSICIELKTPRNLRVELLCEEYQHLITDTPFLFGKLDCLKGLQSNDQIEKWRTLAQDAQWQTFVEDLLINHYDPAYDRSMFRNFTQAANAQSVEAVDISQSGFAKVAGAFPL